MKKNTKYLLCFLLASLCLLSPLTAFASSGYINNESTNIPQRALDEVEWMVDNNRATIRSFSDESHINNFISCDADGNIYNLVIFRYGSYPNGNVSTDDYEAMFVQCTNTTYSKLYKWDYTNRSWTVFVSDVKAQYFYGDSSIQGNLSEIASAHNLTYNSYYCGDYLIWYRTDDFPAIGTLFTSFFPLESTEYFEGKFEDIQNLASIFIRDYIKPFIDVIIAEPLLFIICLFGVIVSIVGFVYSFIKILSSKRTRKLLRRKRG